jgi:hypothetical protein
MDHPAGQHIVLKLETETPVELSSFIALFVGIGNQFERFANGEHPDDRGDARFYVQEVRAGSIIATLVPYFMVAGPPLLGAAMAGVKHANDLAKFVENLGLKKYFKRGQRDETAKKSDLNDYLKTLTAVATDNDARLSMSVFEDKDLKVAFAFDTTEARQAEARILDHKLALEKTTDADHPRVLMVFTRTNVAHAKAGKRSGEQVKIEAIHPRSLPIVYASTLAEERIRHEIAEADDNVYKKAFDVDVNVEMLSDRPVAYRIMAFHDVIDLPD